MSSHPVVPTPERPAGGRPHLPPVPASTSDGGRSRRTAPLAWLPWALLGLLLLTLLVVALLARAADGGGGRAADDTAAAAPAGGATDAAAPLSVGGSAVVGLPASRLAALQGQPAQGSARVESVVADEGFWVGDSAEQRVFVFLTPEARRSAGESGFQVEPGQTVALKGTVKASSPEFARSVGVTDEEGARQLVEQGAYVEATEVRLAP